ncbi:cytochrome P450 [Sagittula marina]|uniref:Cytochrome P450 n=1 Tax=Sagittula marina TaxID=943940 RepID=A0A7W6GVI6_9RHOB|nr:hypothetical protein [Sagittula marina]MBB3987379.1 cytochrome P450 [Sagittula marina]
MKQTANVTVTDYATGMKIFRSPDFGVDHPFRATRQIFGPSVLDTEAATHVERKRSWMAQFLPARIASPEVQGMIARAVDEGFAHAAEQDDLLAAAVYIPNRVLLLLLGLEDIDPIEHHTKLRAITDFLETNARNPEVMAARTYLQEGPFAATHALFDGLDDERQRNELLLFSYAAGETTFVAMKCMLLLWAQDPAQFAARIAEEGVKSFLATNMRNDPPLGIATRYCKQDTEIDGLTFAKGDLVHVDIVTANKTCPMSATGVPMDFTFGAGKHSCPGHLLAKAELEAVIERLSALDGARYRIEGDLDAPRPLNFRDPGDVRITSALELA